MVMSDLLAFQKEIIFISVSVRCTYSTYLVVEGTVKILRRTVSSRECVAVYGISPPA
jgi:hypothetical protein